MSYKKTFIETHVKKMLAESVNAMEKKLTEALNSGAIDVEGFDPEVNPMVIPKSIVVALLETEANQYKATGTSFEKEVKKNVKNLKHFI